MIKILISQHLGKLVLGQHLHCLVCVAEAVTDELKVSGVKLGCFRARNRLVMQHVDIALILSCGFIAQSGAKCQPPGKSEDSQALRYRFAGSALEGLG
ncbi:hypothetical protein EGJ26_21605 [Stutzerimonas stutzeri]|nr:hypothetical protein EGJ26_21605 [Stutzerimonas stutzeri]RRV47830.1 hypothetical protein EGJ19_20725 [Stutzerimonas stutzeri]